MSRAAKTVNRAALRDGTATVLSGGFGELLRVWVIGIERARQSLAMWASGPTARPAHATAHLVNSNLDAAFSSGFLLGGDDPTDPLIPRQRGDVGPKVLGCGIHLDGLSEIIRQYVNCAIRESLSSHNSKRACFA